MSRDQPKLYNYPTLYDPLPGIVFTLDDQGCIIAINSWGAHFLGYTCEELAVQPLTKLISFGEQHFWQQLYQEFIENSAETDQWELSFNHRQGQRIQIQAVAKKMIASERATFKVIVLALAVSSPPIALADPNLNAIAQIIPVATVVACLYTGEILYANPQFSTLFQLPHFPILTQKITDFYAYAQDYKTLVEQLIIQKNISNYEVKVKDIDSNIFWVSIAATTLMFAGEKAILASFHDITPQKQALEFLQKQTERERLLGVMRDRIRESLQLSDILTTTVAEVRHFLQADRVIIFEFNPDWSGRVVVESVSTDWKSILDELIVDPCFGEAYSHQYQAGRIRSITDIYHSGLSPCHVKLLSHFQVRSNLVVPILQNRQLHLEPQNLDVNPVTNESEKTLWGLLIAHHCARPRHWQGWEIKLLEQLASQVAIAIQQAKLYARLYEANQQLQNLVISDGLTHLANRRHFDAYLQQEWSRLTRTHSPLSLILADIDYFKRYNDNYGHVAGDECLQKVAKALRQAVKRPADLVARYGGEEFAVILPDTDLEGAVWVAQAICNQLEYLNLNHEFSPQKRLTLSLGVACCIPKVDQLPQKLIEVADHALYKAKAKGRDRIEFES